MNERWADQPMYGREDRAYGAAMQFPTDLLERLDALAARALDAERQRLGLRELEDVLTVGYAGALSGEARMMRLEEQLDELLDTADERRARDLRQVVSEHRSLERSVGGLRAALARLQARFVALGGAVPRY
jgi:hypothetical protein